METQKHVKNTQKRTESEEKTTKTKKFPRKPPETHLIFSKPHNPLPFTITTNENLTKHNGDTKTHQKHPKQELNQKKKQKLRNSHENDPKLTWSSPKPTIHYH